MNPVLPSNQRVMNNAKYVSINNARLEGLAREITPQDLSIPTWNWPPYPGDAVDQRTVIDYFGLMNAINFAFTDFEGRGKFAVTIDGKEILGSTGKSAALWRAHEEDIPILEGEYLATMTRKEGEHIFRGNFEIPMLDERVRLMNAYGRTLAENYEGRFANFIEDCDGTAFGDDGIVNRLVEEMPDVYEDVHTLGGKPVYFRKRAQLVVQLLHGRFPQEQFPVADIDQLTVPADYVVPRLLRHKGVTEYAPELADMVDEACLISSGNRPEIEIRAATTVAADKLITRVNELRAENPKLPQEQIYGAHVDAYLWMAGRKLDPETSSPHHLTRTTDY